VNREHQNSEHQRHLRALRRREADTAKQVTQSREAIEHSLALLRHSEVTQKPEKRRQHSGADHAARHLLLHAHHRVLCSLVDRGTIV
jgi:hypothetical protein